ncbi:MAG: sugar ABC transporter substrate-binding protein [Lachnospiraceae bacterium]|nr:sugar ABC transporter substrate-binding protein [Lachnospiraceae bacterium]
MKIQYRTMYKLIMTLLAAAAALMIAGYVVLHPDISANQKERSRLIGASYMTMNNEFYEILNEQISHRVEAEGDRLILRNPALSVSRQVEQIGKMLDEGISVLILTPVDSDGLTDILKRARQQGVKVIVVDSNVSDEQLVDCTIVSDNYKAGCLLGDYLLQNKENSKVVILTHEAATSGRERVQGFLDTIGGHEGIEVVEKVPCEGQLEIAMPQMEKLIEQGKEFDSVFCLNDPSSLGAAAALETKGLLDKVDIYGIDASPDAKQLIYEGKMRASVAQFPSRIGEEAANAIYDLLDGKEVKSYISVPVELVTKENVEYYNVDRWQ